MNRRLGRDMAMLGGLHQDFRLISHGEHHNHQHLCTCGLGYVPNLAVQNYVSIDHHSRDVVVWWIKTDLSPKINLWCAYDNHRESRVTQESMQRWHEIKMVFPDPLILGEHPSHPLIITVWVRTGYPEKYQENVMVAKYVLLIFSRIYKVIANICGFSYSKNIQWPQSVVSIGFIGDPSWPIAIPSVAEVASAPDLFSSSGSSNSPGACRPWLQGILTGQWWWLCSNVLYLKNSWDILSIFKKWGMKQIYCSSCIQGCMF